MVSGHFSVVQYSSGGGLKNGLLSLVVASLPNDEIFCGPAACVGHAFESAVY